MALENSELYASCFSMMLVNIVVYDTTLYQNSLFGMLQGLLLLLLTFTGELISIDLKFSDHRLSVRPN